MITETIKMHAKVLKYHTKADGKKKMTTFFRLNNYRGIQKQMFEWITFTWYCDTATCIEIANYMYHYIYMLNVVPYKK